MRMPRSYTRTTKELLESVVPSSASFNDVCRRLGKKPTGGNSTNIAKLCRRFGIDTSHMLGQSHARGKPNLMARKSPDQVLVLRPIDSVRPRPTQLRRALTEIGRKYECVSCGCDGTWNGEPLVLEIDHIDSCYWNNVPENLQYLCPNCHAQETKRRQ